jgi:hypothetical protein
MSFLNSLKLLRLFFSFDWNLSQEKLPEFFRARDYFYYYHLPFVIHYPLIVLFSPYFIFILLSKIIKFKTFFMFYGLPLVIYVFFVLFCIMFDKYQYYSLPPTLNRTNLYFALKSSIVVSANLVMFFIHPLVGWIFLILSIMYSFFVSLYLYSRHYKKRFLRTLSEGLLIISLILIIFIIILFINNLIQSFKMLKQFGIL